MVAKKQKRNIKIEWAILQAMPLRTIDLYECEAWSLTMK
jgi:hypothetical protein